MSLETINSVDINFSNGGGEHTANISSSEDVKNADGSPSLGVVNGEIGSKNYFSQSEINKIMGRFICTSVTRNKSPMGVSVSRKYSDITSLILKSYVVLVRGLNAPPDNKDSFDGMFPFFSEVKGSPLSPFPSAGIREIKGKRILVAGKIYNYESTTVLSGLKASLVYQNGDLVNGLSLNRDIVTKNYQNAPNLNSYDLKFGYTLNEYLDMLDYVGVTHKGLREVEGGDRILFQTSGTLASITSAIASFFGFYYFVDPNSGDLNFIDSKIAANIEITDFTQSSDEKIVSANFSENKFTPEIVNTYVGSADKPDMAQGKYSKRDPQEGNLAMFRVELDRAIEVTYDEDGEEVEVAGQKKLNKNIYGAFFSFFSNSLVKGDRELFDKYAFYLMLIAKAGPNAVKNPVVDLNFDFTGLYKEKLKTYRKDRTCKDQNILSVELKDGSLRSVEGNICIEDKHVLDRNLNFGGNAFRPNMGTPFIDNLPDLIPRPRGRVDALFHHLKNENDQLMKMPSTSDLLDFLEGYFEYAGGVYVSSAMFESRSKKTRVVKDQGLSMHGPFHKNELVANCEGLGELAAWLNRFSIFNRKAKRIRDLAGVANQLGVDRGNFYWVGLKPWAFLPPKELEKETLKWETLNDSTEIRQVKQAGDTMLGHSIELEKPDILTFLYAHFILPSVKRYGKAIIKEQLQLTTVSGDPEMEGVDDEDEGNKILVGEPADQEELKELLQRYDLKSFRIDAPTTEQYTPLNLSVANGSTVEMKALRDAMLKDYQSMNIKPLKSSSKTIYGLEIPSQFNITTNSFSIKVGSDGITTTIGESTLKLLPPDQQFVISQGMEVIGTPSINPRLRASQRNYFGL